MLWHRITLDENAPGSGCIPCTYICLWRGGVWGLKAKVLKSFHFFRDYLPKTKCKTETSWKGQRSATTISHHRSSQWELLLPPYNIQKHLKCNVSVPESFPNWLFIYWRFESHLLLLNFFLWLPLFDVLQLLNSEKVLKAMLIWWADTIW